jgi:hypothetical protein
MLRIGNAFMRPLLRSPVGKRVHEVALLRLEGRRTGTRYEVPVAYHELDGRPVIFTAGRWRTNLRGGADVELVHEGRRVPMRAELIELPLDVGRIYEEFLRRYGLESAKPTRIGLEVEGEALPAADEIARAVGGIRAVIRLGPPTNRWS